MTEIYDKAQSILQDIDDAKTLVTRQSDEIQQKLDEIESSTIEVRDEAEGDEWMFLVKWASENSIDSAYDLQHYDEASALYSDLESYYTTDVDEISSALDLKEQWNESRELEGLDVSEIEGMVRAHRDSEARLVKFINEQRANTGLPIIEDMDSAVELVLDTYKPHEDSPNAIVDALIASLTAFNSLMNEIKSQGIEIVLASNDTPTPDTGNGVSNTATVDTDSANTNTEQPSV